jgi:EmrB/QacA subfamily drug resistance transporter
VSDADANTAHAARVGAAEGADGGSFVAYGSTKGRWIIVTMVLGSAMVFLDSTVVNVALPAIGRDFQTGLQGLQWTVSAYLLTLGSLLLLGGALGDVYGRRKVFVIGVAVFTVASILCGVAPAPGFLIAARAAQGVGGALLVPESLAIISAVFRPKDRGPAIGAWSGLSAVATAGGPFLGGYLVDAASWRWVFLINVPIAVVTMWMAVRHVPENRDEAASRRLDITGAVIITVGLAGLVYALIEGPSKGLSDPAVVVAGALGVVLLAAFPFVERRLREPMVPLEIFRSRQFTGANLTTLFVYGALGGALFFVVIELQDVLGYSALQAGAAFWPIPLFLFLLSSRVGRLAQRIGPRLPMTVGPAAAGVGFVLLSGIGPGTSYVTGVLPGVLVFALGLSSTVAPLSTAVLGAVEDRHKGLASGINNAVSRIAGLVAVALLPVASGVASAGAIGGASFDTGFRRAMWISAGLCWAGAMVSFLTVTESVRRRHLRSVPHPRLQQGCCDPALEDDRSAPASPCSSSVRSERAGE